MRWQHILHHGPQAFTPAGVAPRDEAAEPIVVHGRLDPGPARRWTINGDFLALAPTGVARYAREVTLALDRLVTERDPLTRGLQLDLVAPRAPDQLALTRIPIRVVPDATRWRLPQAWVQTRLPMHVPGGLLSFCNLAPVLPRRHIVCIHDLHTHIMPESYSLGFRLAHRLVLPVLGRRAAVITTVSDHSRDQLVGYRIAAPDKIAVTYDGADHVHGWHRERSTRVFPSEPFVLCLGRRQRYKNTELLLRLAERLAALGIAVVMAGDITEAALTELGGAGWARPSSLHVLGRISDDDLARGLSQALCFAFPSRIEGFGLPAVEAMMLGCPVVAANAPALPEICRDAALYADPDDLGQWVSAITSLRADPRLRAILIERGHRLAASTYSWRTIASGYLRLMARVDAGLPATEPDATSMDGP